MLSSVHARAFACALVALQALPTAASRRIGGRHGLQGVPPAVRPHLRSGTTVITIRRRRASGPGALVGILTQGRFWQPKPEVSLRSLGRTTTAEVGDWVAGPVTTEGLSLTLDGEPGAAVRHERELNSFTGRSRADIPAPTGSGDARTHFRTSGARREVWGERSMCYSRTPPQNVNLYSHDAWHTVTCPRKLRSPACRSAQCHNLPGASTIGLRSSIKRLRPRHTILRIQPSASRYPRMARMLTFG